MKEFRLSAKFYIIFSLLFSIPASYLAFNLQSYLNGLDPNNFLHQLASSGVIEPPTTVAILLILFWLTDNFLWRVTFINAIPGIPPDISGRYEGNLVSNYEGNPSYKIAIEIKQSLTKISVKLYTENSRSFSLTSAIGRNNQDNWSLYYLYQNTPQTVKHDEDMKDHQGTATLDIFDAGNKLKGTYFNNPRDRGRHGSINVERVKSGCLGSFK